MKECHCQEYLQKEVAYPLQEGYQILLFGNGNLHTATTVLRTKNRDQKLFNYY